MKHRVALSSYAFSMFLACVLPMAAQSSGRLSAPVLTNAQKIRELLPTEAAQSLQVRLRATVNYFDPVIGELFVQDATNGVFVFVKGSKVSSPLSQGQLIDIAGVTTPRDYAPAIARA